MKADLSVEDGHLCNMGKMIEELEGKLRNQLDQVYHFYPLSSSVYMLLKGPCSESLYLLLMW